MKLEVPRHFLLATTLVVGSFLVLFWLDLRAKQDLDLSMSMPFVKPSVPFGVQDFGDVNDSQKRALMVAAGVKWVRQDVYWNQIEV